MSGRPSFSQALWRIYNRPERPISWAYGGNLPWDEPEFSARMLNEHLDEAHGAASRTSAERAMQISWMRSKLGIDSGDRLFDITCGPGLYAVELATEGIMVDGVDFGPAAIEHARRLAAERDVIDRCNFELADIRYWDYPDHKYDGAILLYGQLAVFSRDEAATLLRNIERSLRPGAKLVIELLNQDRVDKEKSSWWYTDDSGLWGSAPYMVLGERQWRPDEMLSMERYYVMHLDTGKMDEIVLCDQTYAREEMQTLLLSCGFQNVQVYAAWDGVPLYDGAEWDVYIAYKKNSHSA